MSLPIRILVRVLLTMAMLWAMTIYMDRYFSVIGGPAAYVIIASLLTLLNILVRPILDLATLPLKLFAALLAIIIVNGAFMWLTIQIVEILDTRIVELRIAGFRGWILAAAVFGLGNWLFKHLPKQQEHN